MATRKAAKKKSRRTVMYSSGGKKLYAVRDASGQFKDIQQYSRAHAMDIKRGSSAESKAAAKKAAKKTTRKTTSRTALGKAVKGVVQRAVKRTRKAAGSLVKRPSKTVGRARAKR
jgi:hypothetical protein